ncbi:MAG: hypothetical protein HY815_10845 [Candidatus Riflebacteria bacterium]|nr:hypothetical protein [Candidatus Riflebacteria bacterium]
MKLIGVLCLALLVVSSGDVLARSRDMDDADPVNPAYGSAGHCGSRLTRGGASAGHSAYGSGRTGGYYDGRHGGQYVGPIGTRCPTGNQAYPPPCHQGYGPRPPYYDGRNPYGSTYGGYSSAVASGYGGSGFRQFNPYDRGGAGTGGYYPYSSVNPWNGQWSPNSYNGYTYPNPPSRRHHAHSATCGCSGAVIRSPGGYRY